MLVGPFKYVAPGTVILLLQWIYNAPFSYISYNEASFNYLLQKMDQEPFDR